jgi:sodium/hydrogen exchanger 10/11
MTLTDNFTTTNDHDSEQSHGTVILFLSYSVLAACVYEIIVCKLLKNRLPIPFTVVVLILGLIVGVIANHIKGTPNDFLSGEIELSDINPHLLYYIFLPVLIFDSAFNCHFHIVKQQFLSAVLLAGPGVFISMVIVAICSIYLFPYHWSWLEGLLFASILSAKDAIAVIPLLHDSDASKLLISLVDSESLLSDGSTFVAFLTFKNIVVAGDHSAKIILTDIIKYSIGKKLSIYLLVL